MADKQQDPNSNKEPAKQLEIKPAQIPPAKTDEPKKDGARKPVPAAVDFPVIACCGCNSTNTTRIDRDRKRDFELRVCRDCGKQFKEPRATA